MRDARTSIARLGMAGLCFLGIGCGGGGVPDPNSDPSAANDAPPPVVVNAAPAADAAPAPATAAAQRAPAAAPIEASAAPVVSSSPASESSPASAPASAPAVVASPAPATAAEPAPAGEPVTTVAATPAPAGEEKPAPAPKGDASATNELLNLTNNASNTAPPPAEVKGEVPTSIAPGVAGGPGAVGPGADPRAMADAVPGRGGIPEDANPGNGPGDNSNSNAPANYSSPLAGAITFLNAVKSKNKDRIADATAKHGQVEAHSAAMQKLLRDIVELTISDEQVDDLAKAMNGFSIMGLDNATSSGRQKVVLGKSNGMNGQFRRTLTMRHEAKGWKVGDISGQSEIQGMRGLPTRRRTR